jgi:hypothetical protein
MRQAAMHQLGFVGGLVSSDDGDLAAMAAAVDRHIGIDRPDTPTLAINPGGQGPPSADRRRYARPPD